MSTTSQPMPEELSPRRIGRRLAEFAMVGGLLGVLVLVGPGLGGVRTRLAHASPGWVVAGVVFELLSALCYVVIFRSVFCPRMGWGLSYQIGMAEQAANSVLSVSGAGGLALGAWALRRGGMSVAHIARRTVAFFFLTSMANVGAVILFAALYPLGILGRDPNPALTYTFGILSVLATLLVVVVLPAVLINSASDAPPPDNRGRVSATLRFVRFSLGDGIRDGLLLLRRRSIGVIGGSVGTMAFDVAVLGATFKAFGYSPPLGVLALGYLIGQLGGNLPIPGGIGGLDGGLIGAFALYHQPLAATTAAVLVYHAISLWVPALLGSAAFIQLRTRLARDDQPTATCLPLADPIEVVSAPALVS